MQGLEALVQPAAEPRMLGRYLVLDALGQGGMGTVLRAYDRELERPVALKVLHRDLDVRYTQRLRREAQALAKLSHPNVVQVYEVGELDGQTFVAMELVKGQTAKAWMRQEPRPAWRACVSMFVQLGAGLAAAHERGLVHRDFKPGNAIIDEKGRPRVLDFGLARQADVALDDEMSPIQRARTAEHEAVPLEMSLTDTGAVLGTPAYMPPEQMLGREADARSDQFSFCVSLYEAVYGERPYEGSSMMALMVSMRGGVVRPPLRGSQVPAALRNVLLRGLAVDPAQRWPSMEALLEQLRQRVVPRRRRWLALGVAVGLLGIGAGLGAEPYLAWRDRCTGARAQLDGTWDDGRRHELEVAILGTKLSYAPETWERVQTHLDDYADAWTTEHTAVCEASTVRGEQSPETMDLRMGCLRERRLLLRATVNELAQADATVVENAVRAVASLPRLERCADLDALAADMPPPEDPAVAQRVAALDEQLVEARAKEAAGKYEDGLVLVEVVAAKAEALDYEPLMARAWLRQGSLREGTGDYEGAATALERAYDAAVARRMTDEAADASVAMMGVLDSLARYDDARGWAAHADPLSRAAGTAEARAAHLDGVGRVASSQGKLEEARALHEQALAIHEEALGPEHPHVAAALDKLGHVARSQGKLDEARGFHERALAIHEQALGPDHPKVASSLNNLSGVAQSEGKLEEARGFLERALVIKEKALGPDHPAVAASLDNLGSVALSQGELEEARELHARALVIKEKALGPEHPNVAVSLNNLGGVLQSQGKLEEARELYERALASWERALGTDHPKVATALNNLGAVAQLRGKLAEARERYGRALAIRERALGPDHPVVASSLNNLGAVSQSEGKLDEARESYERALAIREKTLGPDHPDVAASLYNLGCVVHLQGKVDEARDFYERALARWEQALGPDHPRVAYALTQLGEALLDLGKPAEALAPLVRALAIRTTHEVDPTDLAETRFILARAHWGAPASHGRDRPHARALAERAREAWAEAGAGNEDSLAEIDRWLAEHPVR